MTAGVRQEELFGLVGELFVYGKRRFQRKTAAQLLRGLIKEAAKEGRLWNFDRNLCAMNQSPRDGGDGEGVSAGLGVGRGASATSGAASCRRCVSTAADSGEDGDREDHCE